MKPITIKDIQLHAISIPYVEPLRTSFGVDVNKNGLIVELTTEAGITGWGEVSVEIEPGYGPETVGTALHILNEFIIPQLHGKTLACATDVPGLLRSVRGNHHAKAGIEASIWDALAKTNEMRLTDYFASLLPEGHESQGKASVGVSIGIQDNLDDTLNIIQKRLNEGYQRIKLKIQPGWDVELARGVRTALPDITLMLDANSAYTLNDFEHLKQLDQFNLLMIEQPLADDDIYEHGQLQPHLKTPICLDESIKSVGDMRLALQVGSGRILNLKPTRVGGFTESLELYKLCVDTKTPLWIGGMLETGIGRAAHIAFASLPGVTLPCDISATNRYFDPDITEPPFILGESSTLAVPDGIGIGVEVQRERLEEAIARWMLHYPYRTN